MIIPYYVDVPYDRRPFVNWLMVAAMVFIFAMQTAITMKNKMQINTTGEEFVFTLDDHNQPGQSEQVGASEPNQRRLRQDQNEPNQLRFHTEPELTDEQLHKQKEQEEAEKIAQILGPVNDYVLYGWNIKGLFGHMWLHGGIMHLLGNLLFLWVFGNAICTKLGNIIYLPLFVFCGLAAAMSHLIINGSPMIGASGAIFGVVGMFLVFFPENEVTCFIMWFSLANVSRIFTVSSYWVIVAWFLFSNILGAIFLDGITNVAYFAHLGGFASGFAIAILMLKMKWVKMEAHERSLLQLLSLEKAPETTFGEANQDFWDRQIALTEAVTAENEANSVDRKVAEPEPIFTEPMVVEEFIRFYCSCGKKIKVPGIHAGISGKCPACSAKFIVPRESQVEPPDKQEAGDLIRFACECGKRIKVSAKLAGKMGRCPACQTEVIIPEKPLA